jgi:hypothetical protein
MLIVLIVYVVGVFLTPVLLKKFCSIPTHLNPLDREFLVMTGSALWPILLGVYLFIKLAEFLLWIYNKI